MFHVKPLLLSMAISVPLAYSQPETPPVSPESSMEFGEFPMNGVQAGWIPTNVEPMHYAVHRLLQLAIADDAVGYEGLQRSIMDSNMADIYPIMEANVEYCLALFQVMVSQKRRMKAGFYTVGVLTGIFIGAMMTQAINSGITYGIPASMPENNTTE